MNCMMDSVLQQKQNHWLRKSQEENTFFNHTLNRYVDLAGNKKQKSDLKDLLKY